MTYPPHIGTGEIVETADADEGNRTLSNVIADRGGDPEATLINSEDVEALAKQIVWSRLAKVPCFKILQYVL